MVKINIMTDRNLRAEHRKGNKYIDDETKSNALIYALARTTLHRLNW